MKPNVTRTFLDHLRHDALVLLGSVGFTAAFFLVLPLMEAIGQPPSADLVVQSISTADVPPPPPPPEEEKPEEEPDEEKPPELQEDVPQLDLSQLEVALNPGVGGDLMGGDFAVSLNVAAASGSDVEAIFSQADLDQAPVPVHQPSPQLTAAMRKKAPGRVVVIFEVDQNGRVQNPRVRESTDALFDGAVLSAIKQWKFEPGKRNGEPVRTRMLQPFTIPR